MRGVQPRRWYRRIQVQFHCNVHRNKVASSKPPILLGTLLRRGHEDDSTRDTVKAPLSASISTIQSMKTSFHILDWIMLQKVSRLSWTPHAVTFSSRLVPSISFPVVSWQTPKFGCTDSFATFPVLTFLRPLRSTFSFYFAQIAFVVPNSSSWSMNKLLSDDGGVQKSHITHIQVSLH